MMYIDQVPGNDAIGYNTDGCVRLICAMVGQTFTDLTSKCPGHRADADRILKDKNSYLQKLADSLPETEVNLSEQYQKWQREHPSLPVLPLQNKRHEESLKKDQQQPLATIPISKIVRTYREEHAMTVTEMDRFVCLSQGSIRAIESGKTTPRPKTIARICEKLGVDTQSVLADMRSYQTSKVLQRAAQAN